MYCIYVSCRTKVWEANYAHIYRQTLFMFTKTVSYSDRFLETLLYSFIQNAAVLSVTAQIDTEKDERWKAEPRLLLSAKSESCCVHIRILYEHFCYLEGIMGHYKTYCSPTVSCEHPD